MNPLLSERIGFLNRMGHFSVEDTSTKNKYSSSINLCNQIGRIRLKVLLDNRWCALSDMP